MFHRERAIDNDSTLTRTHVSGDDLRRATGGVVNDHHNRGAYPVLLVDGRNAG